MPPTPNDRDLYGLLSRRLSRRTLFRGFGFTGLGLTGAALVGCDDDDDDVTTPAPTDDTEPTPTPEPTDDETPTPEPAAGRLDELREQGFVRIGFANEAPYGYADLEGNVTGQAPDVAREVLSRMGIPEIDGVVVPFGSLIPGLQARRFDMIAAGMFINPDRCGEILFSDPDYCIPQAFGVQAGNPLDLHDFEDVAANPDATLGVLGGAVEETYALDLGVSDNQLERFDDTPSLAEALQAGRVDAIALTTLSVREQLERLGDANLEMTDPFVPVIDGEEQAGCGGYGFHASDQEFRDAFNEVLNEMKQNDEIVPITEQHGFFEEEIGDARDRTAEELCDGETPA